MIQLEEVVHADVVPKHEKPLNPLVPNSATQLNEAMLVKQILDSMSLKLHDTSLEQRKKLESIYQQIGDCEKDARELLDQVSQVTSKIDSLTRTWKQNYFLYNEG